MLAVSQPTNSSPNQLRLLGVEGGNHGAGELIGRGFPANVASGVRAFAVGPQKGGVDFFGGGTLSQVIQH